MQREHWTRSDLENALRAAYFAGAAAQPTTDDPGVQSYLRGFQAALFTLALSFGLPQAIPAQSSSGAVTVAEMEGWRAARLIEG